MKFVPQKYKLIYFTTATKKHNFYDLIKIKKIEKLLLKQVRVLKV
jgi:hypothetical protein